MAPLVIVAIAVTVAAAAAQAAAMMQQRKVQAQQQRYNAKLQNRQAQQAAFGAEAQALGFGIQASQETEATQFEVTQRRDSATLAQSQDQATIAGTGVELSGSPLLAYLYNVRSRELDTQLLAYEGETRRVGLESQAAQARFQAKELRQSGLLALQGGRAQAQATKQSGYWEAGATLASGIASAAGTGMTA